MTTKPKRAKALKPVIRYGAMMGESMNQKHQVLSPIPGTYSDPFLCIPITPSSKRKMVEVMAGAYCKAVSNQDVPKWYLKTTKKRMEPALAALLAMAKEST